MRSSIRRAALRRAASSRFQAAPRACVLLGLALAAASCDGAPSHPAPLSQDPPVSPQAPPISGGTLLVLHDGKTAVAADSDRDRVSVVDLAKDDGIVEIRLETHDEPGRVVEDGAGRVHVVLRRAGAIATIDPVAGKVLARRPVCEAPRGIAYDPKQDLLHVACVSGDLVSLPAAGGDPVRRIRLDSDLRDVVVRGDGLRVSRFRSAEILEVDAAGAVVARRSFPPQALPNNPSMTLEAAVAWRMVALPQGGALVVHQRASMQPIPLAAGATTHPYYGGDIDTTIVNSTVGLLREGKVPIAASPTIPFASLPVDVAVSADGATMAMVATGSALMITGPTKLLELAPGAQDPLDQDFSGGGITGEPIAVAFDGAAQVIVQTREPASLVVGARVISLGGDDRTNPGHAVFHKSPDGISSLSCASCHPEGRDDGHTWEFESVGPRRTQSLLGGILDTAPFHWDGKLPTVGAVMAEVFVHRMGGPPDKLDIRTKEITDWLGDLPAPPPAVKLDASAVARGKTLFEAEEVGCATCHSGPKYTNNQTVDVGTGLPTQVPSLVGVIWRAPFMHTGCAPTLHDRFVAPCGGGDAHGKTSQLDAAQIDDLVAYLESL